MSRNSKNARNLQRAREFSKLRKEGGKGPAKTNPTHGKKWTYRTNPEIAKRITEMKAKEKSDDKKAAGKKVLEGAGGAAEPDESGQES